LTVAAASLRFKAILTAASGRRRRGDGKERGENGALKAVEFVGGASKS